MIHWIKNRGGKWHGWEDGAKMTLCGRITVLHLDDARALTVDDTAPGLGFEGLCVQCRRLANVPRPQSSGAWVTDWEGLIHRATQTSASKGKGPSDGPARMLANILATTADGPPGSDRGAALWRIAAPLLLLPWWKRRGSFAAAVRILFQECDGGLAKVLHAATVWQKTTNRRFEDDLYKTDRVLEVMLQVPDPEPYVRHLKSRGLEHLAAVFHPNTLARAKTEAGLRGVFNKTNEYWNEAKDHITVVEE